MFYKWLTFLKIHRLYCISKFRDRTPTLKGRSGFGFHLPTFMGHCQWPAHQFYMDSNIIA